MMKNTDSSFYKSMNKKLTLVNKHNTKVLFGKNVRMIVKVMQKNTKMTVIIVQNLHKISDFKNV